MLCRLCNIIIFNLQTYSASSCVYTVWLFMDFLKHSLCFSGSHCCCSIVLGNSLFFIGIILGNWFLFAFLSCNIKFLPVSLVNGTGAWPAFWSVPLLSSLDCNFLIMNSAFPPCKFCSFSPGLHVTSAIAFSGFLAISPYLNFFHFFFRTMSPYSRCSWFSEVVSYSCKLKLSKSFFSTLFYFLESLVAAASLASNYCRVVLTRIGVSKWMQKKSFWMGKGEWLFRTYLAWDGQAYLLIAANLAALEWWREVRSWNLFPSISWFFPFRGHGCVSLSAFTLCLLEISPRLSKLLMLKAGSSFCHFLCISLQMFWLFIFIFL